MVRTKETRSAVAGSKDPRPNMIRNNPQWDYTCMHTRLCDDCRTRLTDIEYTALFTGIVGLIAGS